MIVNPEHCTHPDLFCNECPSGAICEDMGWIDPVKDDFLRKQAPWLKTERAKKADRIIKLVKDHLSPAPKPARKKHLPKWIGPVRGSGWWADATPAVRKAYLRSGDEE